MKFNEIIKDLREKRDITAREVSEAIGVSTSAYLNYERGERQPNFETLCKLADFYGCSTDYLLGRDAPAPVTLEKLLADKKDMTELEKRFILVYIRLDKKHRNAFVNALAEAAGEENAENGDIPERKTIEIPFTPNRASAGRGEWLDDLKTYPIRVYADIDSENADFAVQVEGDSMEPDYPDGCLVLVELKDSMKPDHGTVGLFILNGDGYIKQYREFPDRLHSLNPDYDDIILTQEDNFRYVGKVIGIAEVPDDKT